MISEKVLGLSIYISKSRKKELVLLSLALTCFYYATAFVSELTVLQTSGGRVGAFPFRATAGAGSFVFVTPDF